MIPFTVPPHLSQPASARIPLREAIEQVLQDFDSDNPALPLRDPAVAPTDRPSLRWLRSAASKERPDNPFRRGTAAFKEAAAVLALLDSDRSHVPTRLAGLSLREAGSALAVWRWAKRRDKVDPWAPPMRNLWEDKLMDKEVPAMVRGYALRHALCFALADMDEARFTSLKSTWGDDETSLFTSFQSLFGLPGGTSPILRLWELPDLQYKDLRLDALRSWDGGESRNIWICPDEGSFPSLPPGTAWVIPSTTGLQNSANTELGEYERPAGKALSMRVTMASRHAYLAPSRADLEAHGLVLFPILVELGPRGIITKIRLGDAAPATP